jgi:chromatin remodeling complex protein RSC6
MVAREHLNDDQSYVAGRSTEKVRDLVERVEAAGLLASEVITTSFGYIVPSSILKEGEAASEERSNTLSDGAQEADAEEAKPERKTKARKAETEEGK